MKSWTVLLVGILALAGVNNLHACIGNDLSELRSSYGPAAQVVNAWLFCKDGLAIAVYLDGDKSAMEVFSRDPQLKDQGPLNSKDVDKILALEGANQSWTEAESAKGLPIWLRNDRKILARVSYADGKRVIVVMVNRQ